MLIPDAAILADETVLKADICIIGSGAAGLTLATEIMSKAYGKNIIVLESSLVNKEQDNPVPPQSALRGTEFPYLYATQKQPHRYEDPTVQRAYTGIWSKHPDDETKDFFLRGRIRCYGGTTNCWGGWTVPMAEGDFDRKDVNTLFKWPFARNDLNDVYRRAMKYCSLDQYDVWKYDDPTFWLDKTSTAIAPMPLLLGSKLQHAMFTVMYGDAWNWRYDGKLDFQKVWGPGLQAAPPQKVRLYRNATAVELEGDTWKGVTLVKRVKAFALVNGKPKAKPFYVMANQYVLAASCVENVRLIQTSKTISGAAGNAVGRYLITHPLLEGAATFTTGEMPPDGVVELFEREPTLKGGNERPKLFAALVPTIKTLIDNKIGNFRARVGFGGGPGNQGSVNLNWEQFPDFDNRISLSNVPDPVFYRKEPLIDYRQPQIDYELRYHGEFTRDRALDIVEQSLTALGYAKAGSFKRKTDSLILPGAHAMGATRISDNVADGVVDENCCLHGVRNLYAAGGSVFPTGGYANPTLTIIALAIRLADHLGSTTAPAAPE